MLTTALSASSRRGRTIGRFAVVGSVALLTAGILSGCSAEPAAEPQPAVEPTPTAAAARPTPAVVDPPSVVGTVIPGDCEEIYLPLMFERLPSLYPPLNDPTMADPNFSNTDELEEHLRSLEYLQCTWGAAGEDGIVTAVARVTEEQSAQALAILEEGDFACNDLQQGTRCVSREETDGDVVGETHFLRDDVWLSSLWLNAPVRGYTENMIAALWG